MAKNPLKKLTKRIEGAIPVAKEIGKTIKRAAKKLKPIVKGAKIANGVGDAADLVDLITDK